MTFPMPINLSSLENSTSKEINWSIVCLQYHGGTNFGRTSAVFTTTRYYDEAPLDEYGKCVACLITTNIDQGCSNF